MKIEKPGGYCYHVDGRNKKSLRKFASLKVVPSGEVSNFLLEDYDALLMFMKSELQKKKLT